MTRPGKSSKLLVATLLAIAACLTVYAGVSFDLQTALSQLNLAPTGSYTSPTVLAPVGLTFVANASGTPGAAGTGTLYVGSTGANEVHPPGTTTEVFFFGPGIGYNVLNCTTLAWTGTGSLTSFTITRPGMANGSSIPAWAMYAYDSGGNPLSSTGEGDLANGSFMEPPNYASFTVSSSSTPIANVVFCSHNGYSTYNALPLSGTNTTIAPSCTPSPSGMVAWWPGDGNANDVIGGNNGTLQNSATFATGKVGQAFSFNGVDSEVVVPHNDNQNTGAQISLDAWIYIPNSLGSGFTTASIINKRSSGNNEGYTFELVNGFGGDSRNGNVPVNNGLQFEITTPNGSFVNAITSSNAIGSGQWYFVAGTYDGSTVKVFVNGSLVASKSITGNINSVSDDLVIGRNIVNGLSFPGLIDEVELFNRALTQTEIQGIFNAGSAGKCKTGLTNLSVAPVSATFDTTANLQATLTQASSNAAISNETISFTLNGNPVGTAQTNNSGVATITGASLAGINAGTYPTGLVASFAGDTNFVESNGSAQLMISKATATVMLSNLNYNYDGTPKSATVATNPNVATSVTYNNSAALPTNAGSYNVVATVTDPNYQGSANGTLTISQVPLTITANSVSRPYGSPNPPLGAKYSGFVHSEGSGVLTGTLSCITTAVSGNGAGSPGSTPGHYPINCSGQSSNNYTITYVAGTLTITPAPLVALSATSIVFPNQLLHTTSGQRSVTLTNRGTATLHITSIGASGDFTETNTCGSTVGINASCTIRVRFAPTATGTRNGAVAIADDASDSPQQIGLTGTGIAVMFFPARLTFAARRVGTTSPPQSVFLVNVGSAAVSITGVTITGPNSADFNQTNNCGSSLNGTSVCIINVTFKPRATGPRNATLQITDSDPSSPQSVPLTGTGR